MAKINDKKIDLQCALSANIIPQKYIERSMITVKNIFFPIGQGGFMYSRVENNGNKELDFIYDCGSKTKGFKIDGFLDEIPLKHFKDKKDNKDNKPLIDYLYISHFDTDHINGIKKLCDLVEFKNIIYPFHEDENYRLLNTVYQISKSDDTKMNNDILKIIYNPQENFRLIIGEETETTLIGVGTVDNISDINMESETSIETLEDREKIKTQGYHLKFLKNTNWKLYSFIPALKIDVDIGKIAEDFKKKFSDIETWIRDGAVKEHKQDIKKFYETYFSKTDPFNRSSLVLYSGMKSDIKQSKYSVASTKIIFPQAEYPSLSDCLSFLREFPYRYEPKAKTNSTYALLLTGDAQLKGTDWHEYLTDLKENITTVNLPHHGSKNNMNNKTFLGFDTIKNFLTFAGHNNQYRHPHVKAIQDAIEAQPKANIIHVNQFQGLFEMVTLKE